MSKRRLSEWQRQVLADLRAVTKAFPDDVAVIDSHRIDEKGSLLLRLRIRTADITTVEGGLRLRDHEEFNVTVNASELVPPRLDVDHLRFLHHAHVLQGTRPCLYLDPSREWDPVQGFGGFLDRLLEWLDDAASARFDAQTALYHAVGGVLHTTDGAPTIVIRDAIDPTRRVQHGWLVARTLHRFELTQDPTAADRGAEHVPMINLRTDLPLGAGTSLRGFLCTVADPYAGYPPSGRDLIGASVDVEAAAVVLTAIAASAIRKPDGSAQRFVLAVPHPTGGPAHLLAGRLPAGGADHIRDLVRKNRKKSSVIVIDPTSVDSAQALDWVPVSDEREEVTTRRDSGRPVAAYAGKTVHIWGCGGLGSWIAEYLARANVKKLVLSDPGRVSGGLLVRQNFVEDDVGNTKVEALAHRLRAINDQIEVVDYDSMTPGPETFAGVDLIVDATVSVAIGRFLDAIANSAAGSARPILAHIACDARTGTLGILTVSMAPLAAGPITIDRAVGEQLISSGVHEAFHGLWGDPVATEEIIPTRGCSTPTFHGSAADLASVAASLASILGAHLGSAEPVSGTHLISMPHGEAGPLRTFVAAPTTPAIKPVSPDPDDSGGAPDAGA